jgi:hypothetical protein
MRTAISLFCWRMAIFRIEESVSANQTLGVEVVAVNRRTEITAAERSARRR